MKLFIGVVILALLSEFESSGQSEFNSINMERYGNQNKSLKLFLCGDVMTGRGIDQALPFPVNPVLYESYVKDARVYLQIAEQKNGKIEVPVAWEYLWGDAMEVWDKYIPDLKALNLETSITTHPEFWPGKGINYRMNPKNIKVLTVAGIDHCSLANNHIMDWGQQGLEETINTLREANIQFSGAGMNLHAAASPSVFETKNGRVLIYSYATPGSGVPAGWAAKPRSPGVNILYESDSNSVIKIKQHITQLKRKGDLVVFSVHWGGNWGYFIPDQRQEFAHRLIKDADVDLIFGHSSHHPLGMEVYKNKLIIYGAGDFMNDYEGISGHEKYRGELTLMYFPELDFETGMLKSLMMIPMEIKNFRLNYASAKDAEWLQKTLNRECIKLGAEVRIESDNSLWLEWKK